MAPNESTAEQALDVLNAEWRSEPQPSRDVLFQHLKDTAEPRRTYTETGSIPDALTAADRTESETYTVDYIAHTPLETRAGVAEWSADGKLTVWTGTQRPFGVRDQLSRTFDIDESRVRVIMPDTGSGYGGKHTGEAGIEAARLAKAAGKPVRVVWTREEEYTWAYFRPAGVIEIQSVVNAEGDLIGWPTTTTIQVGLAFGHPTTSPTSTSNFTGAIRRCGRALTGARKYSQHLRPRDARGRARPRRGRGPPGLPASTPLRRPAEGRI